MTDDPSSRRARRVGGDPRGNAFASLPGGKFVMEEAHQKVKAAHLKRNAYLYIRQSTLPQVFDNSESTERQYALRQRTAPFDYTTARPCSRWQQST